MKIILLIVILIPIFAFHVFVFVDVVNSIKIPANKKSVNIESIAVSDRKSSRKSDLRIVR